MWMYNCVFCPKTESGTKGASNTGKEPNSLLNYTGEDDFQSEKHLTEYAETLFPCVYEDFMEAAKQVLTPRHREGLRKLLQFEFKKHSRYNLSKKRLKLLQIMIQKRANSLLAK